jgi:hypothetical protein
MLWSGKFVFLEQLFQDWGIKFDQYWMIWIKSRPGGLSERINGSSEPYCGFCSIKQLGALLPWMGCCHRLQALVITGTHLYSWIKRSKG